MIRDIISALRSDDFYGKDDEIDFAKGMYSIPKTFKQAKDIKKRKLHNKWHKAR